MIRLGVSLRIFSIFVAAGTTTILWPTSIRAAPVSESYRETVLANGLSIITMPTQKVPLVTIVLASRAGGISETPETSGLTHLWEHMFFKGNKTLPNQEAFKDRILELGIHYNGDTSTEVVRYYFTLPSVFLKEGLKFMADAISTPLLEVQEIERERKVVLNEYERAAANPGFDHRNLARALLYGDKAYHRDSLGWRSVIEKATREQLLKIKGEVFVPKNCVLLVAGDFDPAQIDALIAAEFSSWQNPPDWKPLPQNQFPPFPKTTELTMIRPIVENANITRTFAGPLVRAQPEDTYAADVLASLLQHRSGKFFRKFIDSGLALDVSFGYTTQSQAGENTFHIRTAPERAKDVLRALQAEIPAMAKKGYFSRQELTDVRRTLEIGRKLEQNLPSEYIKTLAFWWAVAGLDYYRTYLPNMTKTDLAAVSGFVKKWLVDKPHVILTLVSPESAAKAGFKDTAAPEVTRLLAKNYDVPTTEGKGK